MRLPSGRVRPVPNPSTTRRQLVWNGAVENLAAERTEKIDKNPSIKPTRSLSEGSSYFEQVDTSPRRSRGPRQKHKSRRELYRKSSNQRLECKLKQEFRFMCIVCMDDLQFHETTKLKCGHQMCNRCLKQSFKLSITDPQHMPPRCFSSDPIPFEYVDQLFDLEFKKAWYKKMCAVYASRNPIYCPKRGCGEFIQQQDIRLTKDRSRYGKCPRCSTKVCLNCCGPWHGHCHKDEATARRLEAEPEKETSQHCISCKSLVEISQGCNHVTWYVLSTFLLDSCLTT